MNLRKFTGSGIIRTAIALSLLALAGMSGCGRDGGQPEAPPPLQLSVVMTDDANPDPFGSPAPVVVVVYELASETAFGGASFNDLFYDDREALAGEAIGRQEFELEPGERVNAELVLDERTQHLGFVVGFREIEGRIWRATVAVPALEAGQVTAVVGRNLSVLTDSAPAKDDEEKQGFLSSAFGWLSG